MIDADLASIYREDIDCLNRQDWASLHQFVDNNLYYNGQPTVLSGYRVVWLS